MEHLDVVIVGAGLSGIGAACHLKRHSPGKTFTLIESRPTLGGTWDLYRYPGIRSDSDMHTLGYNFKPWVAEKAIADGTSILEYMNETADEFDVRRHIRFERRVVSASWSSEDARWSLEMENTGGGRETITCGFLLMCSGYYSYSDPYRPHFEGEEDFEGTMFHPQHWPKDLDYRGKRVIVIGSGATAMTIIPSMADEVEHITMLQRSPTYVVSRPAVDKLANLLRRVLPAQTAYEITRFKNTQLQRWLYGRTRMAPERVKKRLLKMVQDALGPDYDVATHFTPRYNPWDQRMCLIPDGDLYDAINAGKASVVTDQIERVTKRGILVASGEELEADIIVVATGLQLELLGGITLAVDGKPVNFPDHYTYKGMMFSDVPNFVQTFGYINASWTLRADLTAEYACRLLNRMDELGMRQATPRLADADRGMRARNWIEDFTPGYMQREMHRFPKQGDHEPWLNTQNFSRDKKMIRNAPLEDGRLAFDNPEGSAA